MICIEGVAMPQNCHECDSFGISDLHGIKCPCAINLDAYDFDRRPTNCPLHEVSNSNYDFSSYQPRLKQ